MVKERECEKCGKVVPSSDVKLVFRGKGGLMALCSECRSKIGVEHPVKAKVKSEKKTYYCAKCRYKFKFDAESGAKLHCPFCGDTHYVTEHEVLTSESLLRTVDK